MQQPGDDDRRRRAGRTGCCCRWRRRRTRRRTPSPGRRRRRSAGRRATGFQVIGSGQPATSRGSNTHTRPRRVRDSTMASRISGFVEVVISGPGASRAAPIIRYRVFPAPVAAMTPTWSSNDSTTGSRSSVVVPEEQPDLGQRCGVHVQQPGVHAGPAGERGLVPGADLPGGPPGLLPVGQPHRRPPPRGDRGGGAGCGPPTTRTRRPRRRRAAPNTTRVVTGSGGVVPGGQVQRGRGEQAAEGDADVAERRPRR